MISFALDDDQGMLRDTVRKFAVEVIRPHLRKWERAGALPSSLRGAFRELGLSLVDVAEALGGVGAGTVASVVMHEELACGDAGAAVALYAPHSAAAAIEELGDAEQAKRLLARFVDGGAGGSDRLGAVAWSETGGGVPLAGFATTAAPVDGGYVLRGQKAFVVNAGGADLMVVFAQLAGSSGWGGIGAFVVEGGDGSNGGSTPEGVVAGTRHAMLGLETVVAGEVIFNDVFVREENRLRGARAGFVDGVRRFFQRVALMTAARQVGLARASYELALQYTQERRAFGKPVAHFQAVAFTLADMLMDLESARWLVWRAAGDLDRGDFDVTHVAHAAVHANEAAWRVADRGVQLLGGAGFIQDFPAEKWLRDTKALALFSPTDQLWQLAAASVALGHAIDHALGHAHDPDRAADAAAPAIFPSSAIQPIYT